MDNLNRYYQFGGYSEDEGEPQQVLRRRRGAAQRQQLLGDHDAPDIHVMEEQLHHVVDQIRVLTEVTQKGHMDTHEGVDNLLQGQQDIMSNTEKLMGIAELTRKEMKEGFNDIRESITGSDCLPINLVSGGIKRDGYEHGFLPHHLLFKRGFRFEFKTKKGLISRLMGCIMLFIRSLIKLIWVLHTVLFKIDEIMTAFIPEFTGILGIITLILKLIIRTAIALLYVQVLNVIGLMVGKSEIGWQLFDLSIMILRKTIVFTIITIKSAIDAIGDSEFFGRLKEILSTQLNAGLDEIEPVIGATFPRSGEDVYNATGLSTLHEQASDLIGSIRSAGQLADTVISPVASAAAATGQAIGSAGGAVSDAAGSLWGSVTDLVTGLGSSSTHLKQDGGAKQTTDIYTKLSTTIFNDRFIAHITRLADSQYPNKKIIESHIAPNIIIILQSSSMFVNSLMTSTEHLFDYIATYKPPIKSVVSPIYRQPLLSQMVSVQAGGKKKRTKQPYSP
jgi:hypothetical protein